MAGQGSKALDSVGSGGIVWEWVSSRSRRLEGYARGPLAA
jgi:hypothetical protein